MTDPNDPHQKYRNPDYDILVSANALVSGNAQASGDTPVSGNAQASSDAQVAQAEIERLKAEVVDARKLARDGADLFAEDQDEIKQLSEHLHELQIDYDELFDSCGAEIENYRAILSKLIHVYDNGLTGKDSEYSQAWNEARAALEEK